jgi:glyoxylase-like metal-dependent hydrolase (beta-lactamase superfamily II)
MDVLDEELKEFQLKLEAILKEFLEQGRVEVYGNLRIVVTSFDKIACLKGNTIYVNIKMRTYPDFVLRYIIAHKLVHLFPEWVDLISGLITIGRVLEDVLRVRVEHPGTYIGHVNLYLLELEDGKLLVDTGFRQTAEELVRSLRDVLRGSRLREVVLTHIHNDHTGGVRDLRAAFTPEIMMHQQEIDVIGFMRGVVESGGDQLRTLGLDERLRRDVLDFFRFNLQHLSVDYEPLRGGEEFASVAGKWRVVPTPGHTPGHVTLYDGERRVLISGDHLLPNETSNVSYYPVEGYDALRSYLRSLVLTESLGPELVLPAHGEPFRNVKERIDYLLAHHRRRLMEAMAGAGRGSDLVGVARSISWSRGHFDMLGPIDRWLAVLETLAHLQFLINEGFVEARLEGEKVLFAATGRDGSELDRILHKIRGER